MYILSMAQSWPIIYYEAEDGTCPLRGFIDARREREQAKLLGWISLLENRGPQLPRPYADLLKDGIHELRLSLSRDAVRVLYFFCYQRVVVLTHAFVKTTRAVPESEIRKAQGRRADFLSRFSEQTVRELLDADL
jgi:phage-related protein